MFGLGGVGVNKWRREGGSSTVSCLPPPIYQGALDGGMVDVWETKWKLALFYLWKRSLLLAVAFELKQNTKIVAIFWRCSFSFRCLMNANSISAKCGPIYIPTASGQGQFD